MYVSSKGKKYPVRYFEGLSKHAQKLREAELELRRLSKNPGLGKSDRIYISQGKPKSSRYTAQFRKLFPDKATSDLRALARSFGFPHRVLSKVYEKGLGAWKSGGSRPGANAQQWALARTYKFILIALGVHKLKKGDPDTHLHKELSFVNTHKDKALSK